MEREVEIPIGGLRLEGSLYLPEEACGLVVFAHGSGSSRHDRRSRFVAAKNQAAGIGTLLVDLLTPEEDRVYGDRFGVDRLAGRLEIAAYWSLIEAQQLPLGFFGAGTGAAAALYAAAQMGDKVRAVVSHSGRPDLAREALKNVTAPTLLIVGQLDETVLKPNREALDALQSKKKLAIVHGATDLFVEPGALEELARLATKWFQDHLLQPHQSSARPDRTQSGEARQHVRTKRRSPPASVAALTIAADQRLA